MGSWRWCTNIRADSRHYSVKLRLSRPYLFKSERFVVSRISLISAILLWLRIGCVISLFWVGLAFFSVCERKRERERETDPYDSYFNLFREYCCTGAFHWVAPACQVCLIMQKEQKNALQMSDCVPIETEIWQTPWTRREQRCKIHFCYIQVELLVTTKWVLVVIFCTWAMNKVINHNLDLPNLILMCNNEM